jgi:lipid-binding SYLF domain-containing protein
MKIILRMCAIAAAVVASLGTLGVARAGNEESDLREAKAVFQELMNTPDHQVPDALLDRARCIVVIPREIKGAVGVGAQTGEGVLSCRTGSGWSAPVFVSLKGGSWGAQVGVEKTELVLFFMTERGARSLLAGNKVKLGGELSVAAGPFGRTAEASTDLKLNAEIYSYAKSKGLFAGASLSGATLKIDKEDNAKYYGRPVSTKDLMTGEANVELRPEAQEFISVLPMGRHAER